MSASDAAPAATGAKLGLSSANRDTAAVHRPAAILELIRKNGNINFKHQEQYILCQNRTRLTM